MINSSSSDINSGLYKVVHRGTNDANVETGKFWGDFTRDENTKQAETALLNSESWITRDSDYVAVGIIACHDAWNAATPQRNSNNERCG